MSVVLVTTYLSISYLTVTGIHSQTPLGASAMMLADTTLTETILPDRLNSKTAPTDGSSGLPASPDSSTVPPKKWMSSYEEASRVAIRHKLPMLLHFDAPWCGACRQMEATVLNDSAVRKKLGSQVVGVRLNADTNQDLIAKFGITTLPTEVVILSDGTQGSTFVGATSLTSYLARIDEVSGQNIRAFQEKGKVSDAGSVNKNLRSCLIVTHNGEMVGLGGFSPVSLHKKRTWEKGKMMYVATHDGVDYCLTSPEQLAEFQAAPAKYIPRFHGCDLVQLRHENEALTGAIEFGAFYEGHIYFFASTGNRDRFQKNPLWYLQDSTAADVLNPASFAETKETAN